jgi:uncharacterized membrane protein YbhN (UPF0104 family)
MQSEKKNKRIRLLLSFLFKTGIAAGIIWWLIHKNHNTFISNMENINYYWLLPASLAYVFHMIVCAWRWYKLALVLDIKISFMDALALTMKGYFFSLVIPGGAIGGDIAKIGFLNRHSVKGTKAEGAFSILMDRMTGMAGMFSLALVMILFSLPVLMKVQLDVIPLDDTIRIFGILGLIAICLGGLGAMAGLFFHSFFERIKPIGWLMHTGDKYGHGIVSRFTKVLDTYRNSLRLVIQMCMISVVFVHLNIVLVFYFIMKSLGMSGMNPMDIITAITVGDVAGMLPSNSGLGLRDITVNVILDAAGIPNGATIPIIFSVILVVYNLLAGLFFFFDFRTKDK